MIYTITTHFLCKFINDVTKFVKTTQFLV